ncbi:androgen-dependent TFPI-regulating protein isoform X2 [Manduca sexta]|uniref:androgen-dependent TFPI-regulating protein isoform X2 n=1 Tax=Manduca sexta TaxID=7130 RepID=UPI0011825452|nr:androgen-dependent TFPI-regulating protein isoform X2 [Manduca sexta]
MTLSIDTTVDEDVRVRAYIHLRWKLLTSWYNFLTLAYLPLCIYYDCQQKRGFGHARHVQKIRDLTDLIMTGILFPIILSGCILFWGLMNVDPSLIGPSRVFDYLPNWCQHSLHSVPTAMVFLDLLLTPRSRPKSLVPRFLLAAGFVAFYSLMVYISHQNGEVIYTLFTRIGDFNTVIFMTISYILYISLFFIQWKIIGYVWGPEALKQKFKEKL